MTEPQNKPSPEELMNELLEDEPECDDAADLASMTSDELDLELKAGGYTPDKLRKSVEREMEMIRAAGEQVETPVCANNGEATTQSASPMASVVPFRRRRARRWTMLAAALVAAALAAMPAVELIASHGGEENTSETEDAHMTGAPAPPVTPTDAGSP
jgi:hypothetical protein